MPNKKISVKDITAAAAFVIVLGISSILGMKERENTDRQQKISAQSQQDMAGADESFVASARGRSQTSLADAGGNPENPDDVASPGSPDRPEADLSSPAYAPVLSEAQTALADKIMNALMEGNMEEAARTMGQEEEALQDLFYTTMNKKRYFYDGKSLSPDIDGHGMVFTRAGTVYYGSFKDGKPEGQCMALQVVNLNAPRYDYAEGLWKNGKMEGPGHTGYCYYETSPEGEARDICKTGTFSGDSMEGEVVYTSMNKEDQSASWKFTVDQGAVVLDDRWQYKEDTGEYQLLSEDDDSHAYVVGEGQISLPVLKNLLVWEE